MTINGKRITRWTLRLVLLAVILSSGVVYGYFCREHKLPGHPKLRKFHNWLRQQPAARKVSAAAKSWGLTQRGERQQGQFRPLGGVRLLTDAQREVIKRIGTLGYLSGYHTASAMQGVTLRLPDKTCDGYNLYTSGHAQEALLINMEGEVVHRWAYDVRDALADDARRESQGKINWWVRSHLFDNGDLITILTDYALVKLDKNSRLIWVAPGRYHHDLHVAEDGTISALKNSVRVIPRIHGFEPVLDDTIVILDPSGELVRSFSVFEAFEGSPYDAFLEYVPDYGDVLHTNTIEVFDGSQASRSPLFRKGNILVCCHMIDAIAIIDGDTQKVVWGLAGQWLGEHHPQLLENGNMLIFDNRVGKNMSIVLEFDPFTQARVWSFTGTKGKPFYTEASGTVQRLPNGNTLINESCNGRAFEVTPSNEIVWEYYNPGRAGERDELIAVLFDFQRVGCGSALEWLRADEGSN